MTTPERSRNLGSDAAHEPVLVREVVQWLEPRPDGTYVDCTTGLGGHTSAIVRAGAGRVIAIDRDAEALAIAQERLGAGAPVEAVHADYRSIAEVLAARGVTAVDGILADLGVSSWQLDDPGRGFSFRAAGPLDMRMDRSAGPTLADRLAGVDETELADVIWKYGEERHSRRVARAIVRAREAGSLEDTAALARAARSGAGGRGWQRIDPATRTFQGLRIWVNDELEGLDRFVESAVGLLSPGGRLVVIAFQSLEDRVIKHTFRRLATEGRVHVLTKRPIGPADDEIDRNPRARSARLRAVETAA